MVADLDLARATEVADEVNGGGGRAVPVGVDTSSIESTAEMMEVAMGEFPRIDAVVAAAGISHAAYVSRTEEEQVSSDRFDRGDMFLIDKSIESWQKVLDVNLTGVMLTNQAVAKHMVEHGEGGTIVNIASMAGVTALKGSSEYCVSKAGVIMLTKVLSLELARFRVRVNAVGPGYIRTPMSAAVSTLAPRWVEEREAETPLGRLGEPVDIANACLYLSCDESSFVTGETIFPDGGLGAHMRA